MSVASKRRTITILNNGELVRKIEIDHSPATVKLFAADPAWTTHRPLLASFDPIQPEPLPRTGPQTAAMLGDGIRVGTEPFPHQVERELSRRRSD